jgi:hypothetical protein
VRAGAGTEPLRARPLPQSATPWTPLSDTLSLRHPAPPQLEAPEDGEDEGKEAEAAAPSAPPPAPAGVTVDAVEAARQRYLERKAANAKPTGRR